MLYELRNHTQVSRPTRASAASDSTQTSHNLSITATVNRVRCKRCWASEAEGGSQCFSRASVSARSTFIKLSLPSHIFSTCAQATCDNGPNHVKKTSAPHE